MSYVGTTTALAGAGTFTSPDMMTNTEDRLQGVVLADQTGTLFVEQGYPSAVGGTVTWAVSKSIAVVANTGQAIDEALVAPKWRLRYVNGATPQTSFALHAHATSSGNS
jgi:hypothetical protein